eukprot:CAMPEP_0168170156 /NCGR_PEP_ID=MMETSP0139_2-20121125/4024_1 /TAXON_ID=44445 /ORGANISM="Pseudo-nitzschia australis, Strain 10249 10 AB" /LENGTH=60 /DNA_ID=CAMNT_0008087629 /DNA_START=2005 /DNA_END=2187 /DNA_ORIENTATION=-
MTTTEARHQNTQPAVHPTGPKFDRTPPVGPSVAVMMLDPLGKLDLPAQAKGSRLGAPVAR